MSAPHMHGSNAHREVLKESMLEGHFFGGHAVFKSRALIALLLLQNLVLAGGMVAQGTATPTQRKTSEPYTGNLSIFDSPGRDERLQTNRVMDLLGIAPGKAVADIGAGSGWFTVRAARRVGAGGMVYAVDINAEAIKYIGERAKKEQLQNVKTVLSKADDPLLPAGSVDAVLMLKTYHEMASACDACCGICAGRCVRGRRLGSSIAMGMARITGWDAMWCCARRQRRGTS